LKISWLSAAARLDHLTIGGGSKNSTNSASSVARAYNFSEKLTLAVAQLFDSHL
jgi:hypothetical protein